MASNLDFSTEATKPSIPDVGKTASRDTASGAMRSPLWHRVRWVVAILFAAATIFYSAVWMYYVRETPQTSFGMDVEEHSAQRVLEIQRVFPGGPADRAGLRAGDEVLTIFGRPMRDIEPLHTAVFGGHPGDKVPLEIRRPDVPAPIPITVVLGKAPQAKEPPTAVRAIVEQLLTAYPVLFVVVGLAVLFLRIDDRNAWLLAVCFAGLIASAPVLVMSGLMSPGVRRFVLTYMITFFPLEPAAFYYLFATFPARSPIDIRFPWIKYLLLAIALLVVVPSASVAIFTGSFDVAWRMLDVAPHRVAGLIGNIYYFGGCGLGLAALVWNLWRAPTVEARRKTQVMVWGTVLSLTPWLTLQAITLPRHMTPFQLPFWAWSPAILALFLFPLSFAYAVVKYRVLEIPVLLRRSARYLLVQRGFLILILVVGLVATFALAHGFSTRYPASSAGIPIGVAFGMVLIGSGTWVQQRVSERVDKAFFRTAYDSKQILEELVERTREVRTRTQLSNLLESNLRQALQPAFLLVYLLLGSGAGPEEDAQGVSLDSHLLDEIFSHDQPYEVVPTSTNTGFERIHAECLVPISGRDGQRLGLLVLGPRLSEEPYSREDKRLLALVAKQAGSTLESIQMGEEIAERMAAEKRAALEIDLARQVQRKLFPQNPPRVTGLDYAGECVQARVVGGDYYDFFELAPGLIGLALADISGKGFPAALLMANLQANLRGQYALAFDDMPKLLSSVNRLFFENSEANHYATMFFGCYDALKKTLRYVNCGHNPPLLLLANNTVRRLEATATVMGLFPQWECCEEEVQLASGDLFAIYTDGVTEAAAPDGEEFGEERLIDTLRRDRNASASLLLRNIIETVESFSPGEQGDDITVVLGKVL